MFLKKWQLYKIHWYENLYFLLICWNVGGWELEKTPKQISVYLKCQNKFVIFDSYVTFYPKHIKYVTVLTFSSRITLISFSY